MEAEFLSNNIVHLLRIPGLNISFSIQIQYRLDMILFNSISTRTQEEKSENRCLEYRVQGMGKKMRTLISRLVLGCNP